MDRWDGGGGSGRGACKCKCIAVRVARCRDARAVDDNFIVLELHTVAWMDVLMESQVTTS
jgi:hypothetical protein